jgi:hypothetical protein
MSHLKLFAGVALALAVTPAFVTSPAMAQASQTMGAPTMGAPAMEPAKSPAGAAATGTAVNTSGVVEMADLKTGALVRDSTGAEVGTISKVTPGAGGDAATVTLALGGKTTTTSAAALTTKGDALYTTKSKAEVWTANKPSN